MRAYNDVLRESKKRYRELSDKFKFFQNDCENSVDNFKGSETARELCSDLRSFWSDCASPSKYLNLFYLYCDKITELCSVLKKSFKSSRCLEDWVCENEVLEDILQNIDVFLSK